LFTSGKPHNLDEKKKKIKRESKRDGRKFTQQVERWTKWERDRQDQRRNLLNKVWVQSVRRERRELQHAPRVMGGESWSVSRRARSKSAQHRTVKNA